MRRASMWMALALACGSACAPVRERPAGVLAAAAPEQIAVPDGAAPIAIGAFDAVPLARFRVTARVLSTKRYATGREARIAPVDLALGWGRMSDSAVLSAFRISQSFRAFHWSAAELPIPEDEIVRSSANMHLIPASDEVRRTIERVRVGDVVAFEGALVEVFERDRDWSWCSSLTREDSGTGACEVVLVERIEVR